MQREVAWSEWGSGERHAVKERSKDEEESEADCDARHRRHHGLYGGDHRNLTWRGADKTHGGKTLLAPCGREPAGSGDQDQYRQQERNGSCGQNEL